MNLNNNKYIVMVFLHFLENLFILFFNLLVDSSSS